MTDVEWPGRVLFVLASSEGGVGRHVAELAGSFHRAGMLVTVAGPRATDAAFGFSAVAAFEPVEISDRPRPAADAAVTRRLRGLLAATDAVHAHGLRAAALTVLAVRTLPRSRRPPVVVTLHNALVSGGVVAAVHGVLERVVAAGADAVLVVSADLGDGMRARGARRVTRALVPAPPTAPAARMVGDVRASLGVRPGTFLLLTVARLAPQKGLEHLADAVALLAATRPVHAVIAGDGPLENRLRADATFRDLPLRLLGPRDDVPDLLAAADVVIVPSLWEGQPLIVQEALRAGAAVVATDAGGTAEMAGDGVVLVPPGDPEALADAVGWLLDDPAALETQRARARSAARELPGAAAAAEQVRRIVGDIRHAT